MINTDRWLACYFFPDRKVTIVSRVGVRHYFEKVSVSLDDQESLEKICQSLTSIPIAERRTYDYGLTPSSASFYFAIKCEQWEDGTFVWRTPENGVREDEYLGSFLARTLNSYYERQKKLACLRNQDQTYLPVLKAYSAYLGSISEPLLYPAKVESIRELLEKERYLWLSDDTELVAAYANCWRLIDHLYGRYQFMVR